MHFSKDPTLFSVLFEDTAALFHLAVTFVGLVLSQMLDLLSLDGIASLVIGAILAITAACLAYECKGLLTGESAGRGVVEEIKQIIANSNGICRLNELLTMHFGPHEVLLNVSLHFKGQLTSAEVEATVSSLEHQIKKRFPKSGAFSSKPSARQSSKRSYL